MAGILPTLIILLIIVAVIGGYVWFLKRSGYIGKLDESDNKKESEWLQVQYKKAEKLCEIYSKSN